MPVLYLFFLMVAAAFYRRPKAGQPTKPEKFVILVPAHNEALTLEASLNSIMSLRGDEATAAPLVVVVADNCTDQTAELARRAGALVYERQDATLRGKGHALAWAIEKLLQDYDRERFDTLVIFDADTLPEANFLKEAQLALRSGGEILQGRYDVLNPRASWRTLLLYAAFVIYNHIRPLGRAALKLSDGLRGNGMVFRREVLERFPWQAFSLVEDIEYTNRLALAGHKVMYVPQARLYGQAAATGQQATSQRMRWEGGRWAQARQDVPPLLRHVLAHLKKSGKVDFVALDRALDLIIPPLALLVIGLVAALALNAVLWALLGGAGLTASLIGWVALLVVMGLFVFGGLLVARAPVHAYLALLFAPVYIGWKLGLYARMVVQRRVPQEWVRTQRSRIEVLDSQPEASLEKSG